MIHVAHRSAWLAVSITFLLTLTGCSGADARHDRSMQRGRDYFAAESYEKARVEFGNALQITPNDAEARYMSGRVAEKLGKIRDAVGAYQAAIDLDPEHVQARANLARVYVFAGLPDKAMETVEPALVKQPDDPDLLTVRGAARVQLKDTQNALADAEHAVKVAPDNENAVALLASLYRQSENPGRAVELLQRSIAKLPKSVDLRQVLASLYITSGEPALAEAEFETVIKLQPDVPAHRFQLALLYARAKKLDDAERVLKDGIAHLPDNREMKYSYVDFLTAQRSRDAGIAALRGFIAKDPKDFELQLALGALQSRTGDSKGARATYEQVVHNDGDNPNGISARTRIAAMDVAEGRFVEARKRIDEVLAANPRDNDALILRGNLALEANDPAAAIADLRSVLRDQPDAVGVMRVLARAHVANGEAALGEEHLRKAMTLSPKDPAIRVELAQLLLQTQRADQAVGIVEEAVRMSPEDASVRETLTRLYIGTNQLDRAKSAAEDLKTLRPDLAAGFYLAGVVATAQKRDADAQRNLGRALELQPSAIDALAALTRLDIMAGRMPAAIERASAVVAKDPKNAPAHNLLGELKLASNDFDAAEKLFDAALDLAPKWSIPYRNLGLLHLARKDFNGAIAAYQKGVAAVPSEPSLASDLAALYEQQGRSDDAIKLYESILARDAKQEFAANNLAMLLVTYRKDAKSIDRARDLSAPFANTNNASQLDTFGWVRFKRGDHSEGLAALERAAELAPRSKVVLYHLGMAQLQAGQADKARATLKQAVDDNARYSGADEARSALASLDRKTG